MFNTAAVTRPPSPPIDGPLLRPAVPPAATAPPPAARTIAFDGGVRRLRGLAWENAVIETIGEQFAQHVPPPLVGLARLQASPAELRRNRRLRRRA